MQKNNLKDNLYKLRQQHGLSQEEFAEKIGVSRQAVSKWERGEAYPDTENLIVIAETYNVSVDELIDLKKDRGTDTDTDKNKSDDLENSSRSPASVNISFGFGCDDYDDSNT